MIVRQLNFELSRVALSLVEIRSRGKLRKSNAMGVQDELMRLVIRSTRTFGKALVALFTLTSFPIHAQDPSVPPPIEQHHANCDEPTYASDIFVCQDPQLLSMDRALVDLIALSTDFAFGASTPWLEPHYAWFKRRSLCAFQLSQKSCLISAYDERLAVLSAINLGPQGEHLNCRLDGSLRDATVLLAPGPVVTLWRHGELKAVFTSGTDKNTWTPYASIRKTRNAVSLNFPDGRAAIWRHSQH